MESTKKPSQHQGAASRRWRRRLVYALLAVGACWLLYFVGRQAWAGYQYRSAEAAAARHDYVQAAYHFEKYLRVEPQNVRGWLLAARTARQQGLFEDASRFLNTAQKKGAAPGDVELENRLLAVQSGNLQTADDLLMFCASNLSDDVPLILQALAEGALRIDDQQHARQAANLWLKIRSGAVDQAQGYLWLGQAEKQANDLGLALRHFEKAVDLAPEYVRARILLVATLVHDQPDRARPHLDWLKRRRPHDPEVLFQTARMHRYLGEPEKAAELLDRVLKSNANNVQALLERARVFLDMMRPADAEKLLRNAVGAAPDNRQVNASLANCLRLLDRPDEARTYQDRADELGKTRERPAPKEKQS